MALVVLSILEQRLDAVRSVLAGADVTEVAARLSVQKVDGASVDGSVTVEAVGGFDDPSHRPVTCPHQAPADGEVQVAEMRRQHRWRGSRRIRLEMLRTAAPG